MDTMKCDICKLNQNEVLVLKKNKFTISGKKFNKSERVCISCARKLIKKKHYNFGVYWHTMLMSFELFKRGPS